MLVPDYDNIRMQKNKMTEKSKGGTPLLFVYSKTKIHRETCISGGAMLKINAYHANDAERSIYPEEL